MPYVVAVVEPSVFGYQFGIVFQIKSLAIPFHRSVVLLHGVSVNRFVGSHGGYCFMVTVVIIGR